jgi:ABC-2 type transport system permease protein
MDKLWRIALKDIRTRFTDRRLLLIMFAAPLAIATIIGLAFGGLGRSSSPISGIPVAVINNDPTGAQGAAYGAMLADLLTEGQLPAGTGASMATCPQVSGGANDSSTVASMTLAELIHGSIFDAAQAQSLVADKQIEPPSDTPDSPEYVEAAAKAATDKGLYAAVVIIPADFSKALMSLADPRLPPSKTTLSVYGNAGQSLAAGIVRSVVDSITAQLVSGNIAIGAIMTVMTAQSPAALPATLGGSQADIGKLFVCAFSPGSNLVGLADMPVQAASNNLAGTLLVTFGSAQALFFAMFTAQNGILSIYDERRNWTLQRILISPTPRWNILGGKLVGVLVSVLAQLVILVVALTVVGSLIEGRIAFIWGTDLARLGLVLLAVGVAVSGLGIFLAGVLKGIEQANTVGSVLNIALGVLGGAFGFQLPRSIAQFSLIYWARDAFDLLAAGRGDISLNLLVLFVQGAVLFAIGLFLFNRKFEA